MDNLVRVDNRWKPWTPEEDSRILENPEASDETLAERLYRTENAIHCRRAHLAAKMHMQRPEISIDECAAMLLADQTQARQFVEQWRSRKNTLDRFVLSRKRSADEHHEEEPPRACFKPRPALAAPGAPKSHASSMHAAQEEPMIGMICEAIREEEGQLSHLWNDHSMLPTLVKYYAGFRAYAESIRGI